MTQLTTNIKTHKVLVKRYGTEKQLFLTRDDVLRIVQEKEEKRKNILIEGEFYTPYNIGNILKIDEEDKKIFFEQENQELDAEGHRIIYYTDKTPCLPVEKHNDNIVLEFIQYKETLRKPSEGGVITKELKRYKGYWEDGKKIIL